MKVPFKLRPGPAAVAPGWGFHFACLCQWAYHTNPDLDTAMSQATGLRNVSYYDPADERVPAYIVGHDGVGLQLAFAGTDNLRQWLGYVLQFGLEDATGITGRTFRPFNQWSDVLTDAIAPSLDSFTRITLTGHSLGGAMAILVGEKLRARGKQVQGVATFGCPRVGDENFAQNCRNRIVNVRRFLDAVPSMPPAVYVRKSRDTFGLPQLPPLFRPGMDYSLGVDWALRPNVSLLVPAISPLGWIDAIDALTVQRHIASNYVIQLWDWIGHDDKAANKDLYLVMRNGFSVRLAADVAA